MDTKSVSLTTSTNLSGFKGEIDELKIFNTLLESSQIEELFINPRRGLIAYYPFNADNGTFTHYLTYLVKTTISGVVLL